MVIFLNEHEWRNKLQNLNKRRFFLLKTCYKIQKGYVNLNTKTSWYVTRIDLLSCNNTMTGCYCRYSYGVTGLSFHYRGPPLTRKSLTLFPLPRFLAYVRASGGFSITVGDLSTVPLTRILCNMVFSKSQNARKAGTLRGLCTQS